MAATTRGSGHHVIATRLPETYGGEVKVTAAAFALLVAAACFLFSVSAVLSADGYDSAKSLHYFVALLFALPGVALAVTGWWVIRRARNSIEVGPFPPRAQDEASDKPETPANERPAGRA